MIDERYAAGFFDGEGCIHINRNVRIIISGCFRPGLLEQFAQRWGGKVTRAAWTNTAKRRPGVRWEITGGSAHKFLNDVLPFLIEKRQQAIFGIEYRNLKAQFAVKGGKGYTHEQRSQIVALEQKVRYEKHVAHEYL